MNTDAGSRYPDHELIPGRDASGLVAWVCSECPGLFLGPEDHDEQLQERADV